MRMPVQTKRHEKNKKSATNTSAKFSSGRLNIKNLENLTGKLYFG